MREELGVESNSNGVLTLRSLGFSSTEGHPRNSNQKNDTHFPVQQEGNSVVSGYVGGEFKDQTNRNL